MIDRAHSRRRFGDAAFIRYLIHSFGNTFIATLIHTQRRATRSHQLIIRYARHGGRYSYFMLTDIETQSKVAIRIMAYTHPAGDVCGWLNTHTQSLSDFI